MSFVGKGYPRDQQNFIDASFKLHILWYYGHKVVSYDSAVDLDSDSVLCSSSKFLDFEMLLEPLGEQFYQPLVLVQIGDLKSGDMACIRNENEFSALQPSRRPFLIESGNLLTICKLVNLMVLSESTFLGILRFHETASY